MLAGHVPRGAAVQPFVPGAVPDEIAHPLLQPAELTGVGPPFVGTLPPRPPPHVGRHSGAVPEQVSVGSVQRPNGPRLAFELARPRAPVPQALPTSTSPSAAVGVSAVVRPFRPGVPGSHGAPSWCTFLIRTWSGCGPGAFHHLTPRRSVVRRSHRPTVLSDEFYAIHDAHRSIRPLPAGSPGRTPATPPGAGRTPALGTSPSSSGTGAFWA